MGHFTLNFFQKGTTKYAFVGLEASSRPRKSDRHRSILHYRTHGSSQAREHGIYGEESSAIMLMPCLQVL